ncbi:MAG: succinate dehydrogenase cytochrome b subunit, partial [Planctomycetota bacterium]
MLTSSVGKKYIMGGTGLLLVGFLFAHLGGNLLMFVSPSAINTYATALHATEPFLLIMELGLAGIFVVHIACAISLARENASARPVGYAKTKSKQARGILKSAPRMWMLLSGSVALGFIVLHMIDMRFGLRPMLDGFIYPHGFHNHSTPEHPTVDIYARVVSILQTPLSALMYTAGVIFIGFHLSHGFQSAFRSLGFAHRWYTPLLMKSGDGIALALTIGFASIPAYVWMAGLTVPEQTAPSYFIPAWADADSAIVSEPVHEDG